MTKGRTKRQEEALGFIIEYMRKNDMAPSLAEIGEAIGCHKTSARDLLLRLHERGDIVRGPGLWRNISLNDNKGG